MNVEVLLGRQRAEHATAKKYFDRSEKAQRWLVVAALVTILLDTKYVNYFGSLLTFSLSIAWIWCDQTAKHAHRRAERARRVVQLSAGLGFEIHGKLLTDLILSFRSPAEEGERHQDPDYYASKSEKGTQRFAENLLESAFWSRYLYALCRNRGWIKFGIYLVVLIFGLLVYPNVIPAGCQANFFDALCLLLASLVTSSTFVDALSYSHAVSEIDKIETSLDWMVRGGSSKQEDVLVLFVEYSSVTEQTPPIPEEVYKDNKDQLNRLWKERTEASGAG